MTFACATTLAWSACSPAGTPRPSPPLAVTIDASQSDAAPDVALERPEFVRPQPIPGPYLPLTRTFRRVGLSVAPSVSLIAGWDDRVWFLSEGKLLEHDGTKVIAKVPLCEFNADIHTRTELTSLPDGVLVKQFSFGGVGAFTHLTGDGKTCHEANDPDHELPFAMKLRARALTVSIPRNPQEPFGIRLPIRPPTSSGVARLYSVGAAQWLEVLGPAPRGDTWTFRATASGWTQDEPPVRKIGDMWADPGGTVWATIGFYGVVLQSSGHQTPDFVLANHDGKRWAVVPAPKGFRPRRLAGSSSTDIWFVGGSENIFQFDGTSWHHGTIAAPRRRIETKDGPKMIDSPEAPRSVHMTRSGVLWLLTATGRIYRAEAP